MRLIDVDALMKVIDNTALHEDDRTVINRKIHSAPIIAEQGWKVPCDVCAFDPPSSLDGKPCCMCPAVGKGEAKD